MTTRTMLDQGLLHLMDGVFDENRRIVSDFSTPIEEKRFDRFIRPRTAFRY